MSEASDLNQVIDKLYRSESARFIAVLTRAFGFHRHQHIEDVVHMALVEALEQWREHGPPENPKAWVYRVAQNRLLDLLRREKTFKDLLASWDSGPESCESAIVAWLEAERLPDSQLRMMFVCCDPGIDRKSQLILALKTLCGFKLNELSRSLLQSIESVKKRWQRAKRFLAESEVSLELPKDEELHERTHAVCQMLYLLFNEGYSPTQGEDVFKREICTEAMRLCRILCMSTYATEEAKALMALCCFHYARFEGRSDNGGTVIMLQDQDRSTWDRACIEEGEGWLLESDDEVQSMYFGEASIAYEHCKATSFQQTNWRTIAKRYGMLYQLHPSPLYMLNQAIALAEIGEWNRSLSQLQHLSTVNEMKNTASVDCAFAYVYEKKDECEQALASYKRALGKNVAAHEERFIVGRIERLTESRG